MNNEIQVFKNQEFGNLRVVDKDGEPWFVVKDADDALGYANSKDALISHVDSDDREIFQRSENATFDIPNRGITIINESGLYSLIFSSKLPKAKEFKHWVTSEVLPSIRKNGAYITSKADPDALRKKADELESVAALNEMTKLILPVLASAGMKPEFQALTVKQIYRRAGIDLPVGSLKTDNELYDLSTIARKAGIFSTTGKPHEKAVGMIIRQLEISDGEREIVTFEKNGHQGTTYQYTQAVVEKVKRWVADHGYPESVRQTGRTSYIIRYGSAPVPAQ